MEQKKFNVPLQRHMLKQEHDRITWREMTIDAVIHDIADFYHLKTDKEEFMREYKKWLKGRTFKEKLYYELSMWNKVLKYYYTFTLGYDVMKPWQGKVRLKHAIFGNKFMVE